MALLRLVAVLLSLPVLAACGSGGAAAPTDLAGAASSGSPLVAVDGVTAQRVAAEVVPAAPVIGDTVTVRAPGYLVREQRFDGRPVALWPAREDYVQQIVYGWPAPDGRSRLFRWEHPFTVSLDGELASDPAVAARVGEVLAEIRRTTGMTVTLGTGGNVVIGVDAAAFEGEAVGEALLEIRGQAIEGARIRVASRADLLGGSSRTRRDTLLHEMGHVMGLAHSVREGDVMQARRPVGSGPDTFTADEAVCLHMMYAHRRAGNLPVDRDPGAAGAASAERRVVRIVD